MCKTFEVFDLKVKRTPEEILAKYISKHGQPPIPCNILLHFDSESIPLPEGLRVVIKRERFVLKDHLFMEVLDAQA